MCAMYAFLTFSSNDRPSSAGWVLLVDPEVRGTNICDSILSFLFSEMSIKETYLANTVFQKRPEKFRFGLRGRKKEIAE